jgi:hypothetical protein
MSDDVNARLAWQQAIDRYQEQLVTEAEQTLTENRMANLKRAMRTNQLSNFLGVTQETNSVKVIANWVRYQMGRRETRQAWQDTGLGEEVLTRIERMRQWAIDIAGQTYGEPSSMQTLAAHVHLVRLYAGYLKRWYIAQGGQE